MRVLVSAAILIVLTAPARAAWREATSDNFIVYSDGSEAELVSFTQRVEKFDQILRIMTGLEKPASPVKVRVYLVSGLDTVKELDPSHRPLAGFYLPKATNCCKLYSPPLLRIGVYCWT